MSWFVLFWHKSWIFCGGKHVLGLQEAHRVHALLINMLNKQLKTYMCLTTHI